MEDQNQINLQDMRESLVNTAVKFLLNPKVSVSSSNQKQEFLRRKGLTDKEIQKAFEIANASKPVITQNDFTTLTIPQEQQIYKQPQNHLFQTTLYYKVKEIFNAAAIFGATFYCIYWFYNRFIEPFLFGKKKKDKNPVEELDKNIQKSINEVKESINKVKVDISQITQNQTLDPSVPQLVQELKSDITSLKSILLSRKQFPSAPASIPAWQLGESSQNREKTVDREDDAGSGSSTNNSDSSLEMIREDPAKE